MARTNIVLTDELQQQAKALEINVSEVCRGALGDAVLQERLVRKYIDQMEEVHVFDSGGQVEEWLEVVQDFAQFSDHAKKDGDDPLDGTRIFHGALVNDGAFPDDDGVVYNGYRVYVTRKGSLVSVVFKKGFPYISGIQMLVGDDDLREMYFEALVGTEVLDI
jgi:hypothetical protein